MNKDFGDIAGIFFETYVSVLKKKKDKITLGQISNRYILKCRDIYNHWDF